MQKFISIYCGHIVDGGAKGGKLEKSKSKKNVEQKARREILMTDWLTEARSFLVKL